MNRETKLVCLTGFMGSGKTTAGRQLARQAGLRFVDLDERIEARAGIDIPAIFEKLGEPAFRSLEHEVLERAVGEAQEMERATVLALGGGTFVQEENIALLKGNADGGGMRGQARTVVIWLDCGWEQLLTRCAVMKNRPLFRDETSFRQLYEQRLPYYQKADYRVDSSGETREVVGQILGLGIFERVVT